MRLLTPLIILFAAFPRSAAAERLSAQERARLACQISSRVSTHLTDRGQTFRQLNAEVRSILKYDIGRWSDAMLFNQPILGKSQVFYRSYDYFLQNAFINLAPPKVDAVRDENWVGAYLFLSAKRETQYRLREIDSYNLGADPGLTEEIRRILPDVTNLRWPRYEDKDGTLKQALFNCRSHWWYGQICGAADTSPLGDADHPAYAEWLRQAQITNLIATPLFRWILAQPNQSITYGALFERAVAEYKNPLVAIGVISWLFMVDSQIGNRSRGAILSARVRPVAASADRAGDHYHFWGYLMKAMMGQRLKYEVLTAINELLERDLDDFRLDRVAFTFGAGVRAQILDPKRCD